VQQPFFQHTMGSHSIAPAPQYDPSAMQTDLVGAAATEAGGNEEESVLSVGSIGLGSSNSELGSFEMDGVIRSLARSTSSAEDSNSDSKNSKDSSSNDASNVDGGT
jgi:hypothetical protein